MGIVNIINKYVKIGKDYSVANSDGGIRSININIQIIISFLLKSISIILSLVIVPLTLTYLGKIEYGLWVTLLSIVNWLTLMDIGVGNGLRNRLTLALVEDNALLAKKYISNAYLLLSGLSIVFLLMIPFVDQIDWQLFFNIKTLQNEQLSAIIKLFFCGITFIFLLNIINQIFNSFQKPGLANLVSLIHNLFFVISLLVLKKYLFNDIYNIILLYLLSLLTTYFGISIWFFSKNKKYIPSFYLFDIGNCKDILKLGSNFFIIQIAVLLIFSIDNVLIIRLLGPEQATVYNVAFKIYTIPTFAFTIIITPFWSAFTEAYAKKDYNWIKDKILFFMKLMLLVCIGVFILSILYEFILTIWLNRQAENGKITLSTKIMLSLFVIISIWNNIFSYFLNGIGETKLQIITACLGLILNIPLAYLFVKHFNFGLAGIILAMCISLSLFAIAAPIYTFKLLKNKLCNL